MANEVKETINATSNPAATEPETVAEPKIPWRPQDADRFEYEFKESIRNRIRNAQVHPNAVFHKAKEAPSIDDGSEKRVAVYARVSTKSTNQVSSIENQQKYYKQRIDERPNWKEERIYSDEGLSGTSVRKRKAFQEMIQDAKDKKIDLILCAMSARITEEDILRQSRPVDNPLIGQIPTREEIAAELDALLLSM